MNRFMVSIALALLLAGGDAVSGQTRGRIEVRGGRFGAALNFRNLPVHVRSSRVAAMGWVSADWGPVRVYAETGRPYWGRHTLREKDLRNILGKRTVRRIERHSKWLGLGKKLRGRWFQGNRRTVILEVTARGVPVAELYDRGGDGLFDDIQLLEPRAYGRYGNRYRDHRYDDDWDDDWDGDFRRRPSDLRYRHDPRN